MLPGLTEFGCPFVAVVTVFGCPFVVGKIGWPFVVGVCGKKVIGRFVIVGNTNGCCWNKNTNIRHTIT